MYLVGHISPDGMSKKAYFFLATDATSLTAGNCISHTVYTAGGTVFNSFTDISGS